MSRSDFTWTSSSTGIATVSTSGLATGVAQGSTTITAVLKSSVSEYDKYDDTKSGVSGTLNVTDDVTRRIELKAKDNKSSVNYNETIQLQVFCYTTTNGVENPVPEDVTTSSTFTKVSGGSNITISAAGVASLTDPTHAVVADNKAGVKATYMGVESTPPMLIEFKNVETGPLFRLRVFGDDAITKRSTTSNYTAVIHIWKVVNGVYIDGITVDGITDGQDVSGYATFGSSNTAVATITGRKATGVSPGTTYIYATISKDSVIATASGEDRQELTVSERAPFVYTWKEDAIPNHIAQRGVLQAWDTETNTLDEHAYFWVEEAYRDKVKVANLTGGEAIVWLEDSFVGIQNAVYIQEGLDDARRCNVPMESRAPHFECSPIMDEHNTRSTFYVDEPAHMVFWYYKASASGAKTSEKMRIVSRGTYLAAFGTEIVTGDELELSILRTTILPQMSSSAGRLSYLPHYLADGSIDISTRLYTYAGLSSSIVRTKDTFTADNGTIRMGGHPERGTHSFTFYAYNPWFYWDESGGTIYEGSEVMNDYTLYHEPKGWNATNGVGWETTPSYRPVETGRYSVDVANIVVSNPANLKVDAAFADGAGYVGNKVVYGSPEAVTYGQKAGALYRLVMDVPNLSNYDWKALGDYFIYGLGHAGIDYRIWTDSDATDPQKKAQVDAVISNWDNRNSSGKLIVCSWRGNEADCWMAAPPWVTASTPDALNGVVFSVEHISNLSETWRLNYSMEGLNDGDIVTHNAGRVNVFVQIVNPWNPESPMLEQRMATCYVRLHLYVWPAVTGIVSTTPYLGGMSNGWAYSAFPYAYTEGKSVYALERYHFWDKPVLLPNAETYTNASVTTTFLVATNADAGRITNDIRNGTYPATWQFRDNSVFSSATSAADKTKLRTDYLSGAVPHTSPIYTFREAGPISREEPDVYGNSHTATWAGLNEILGDDTYYRHHEYTLYYDPTGNARTYTNTNDTSPSKQLFVIYVGSAQTKGTYFFDSHYGF